MFRSTSACALSAVVANFACKSPSLSAHRIGCPRPAEPSNGPKLPFAMVEAGHRQARSGTGRAILLAGAIGLMPQPADAENASDAADDVASGVIVVTASRRAQAIEDVQATLSVVDRKTIETYQGSSVTEALRMVPGVDARTAGANMTVAIRGFIPNAGTNVLLLFDGLPRTGKYGITNLNNFAPEDVARIEVVRGPMSALYGANAAGGVVNVITRRPGEGPFVSALATYGATPDGDRESVTLSGGASFRTGPVGHRASVWYRRADGFRFEPGSLNEDLSGIDRLSLAWSSAFERDGHELRGSVQHLRQRDAREAGRINRPPLPPTLYTAFEDEDLTYGSLQYRGPVGPGELSVDGAISHSDGATNRSFPGPVETTLYDQKLLQARYALDLGRHSLIAGLGWEEDRLDISINSQKAVRRIFHAYLQDEWRLTEQLTLVAGGRLDDFTLFGTVANPRASLGWRSPSGWFLRAGYGQAFRAPTALENYSSFVRGRFLIRGNEALVPEKTRTLEAAAGWSGRGTRIELVYHDNRVRNLIEVVSTGEVVGGLLVSEYRNRGRAEIRGLEAVAALQPASFLSADIGAEWLEAVDGDTGARLNGRYEYAIRAQLAAERGPLRALVRTRGLFNLWGPDPAIRGGPPLSTDYLVTDLVLAWQIRPALTLSLGVDNLFDQRTPINFSTVGSIEDPPGRYVWTTLRFSLR